MPNVEQGLMGVERDLKSERRRSLGWGRSLRWVVLWKAHQEDSQGQRAVVLNLRKEGQGSKRRRLRQFRGKGT